MFRVLSGLRKRADVFSLRLRMPVERAVILYVFDGLLISAINNFIGINNNLFATRLGATPFELSLVLGLPQFVGLLVLIPGALTMDRLKNRGRLLLFSVCGFTALYLALGFSPYFGDGALWVFLILLALSAAPMMLYNLSMQAFLADTIPPRRQNRTLSARQRVALVVGTLVPLLTGTLLTATPELQGKIRLHQIFVWTAAAIGAVEFFVLRRLQFGEPGPAQKGSLKSALRSLTRDKNLLFFLGAALFFHFSWFVDFSLYYYGQIHFLHATEVWMSTLSICAALIQFLTVGLWARLNERLGVRFVVILGPLLISLASFGMVTATGIAGNARLPVLLIFYVLHAPGAAIVILNMFQCLLEVIGAKNRAMLIAVYTAIIVAANALCPVLGMQVFLWMGGDLSAYRLVMTLIGALRLAAGGLFFFRWRLLRGRDLHDLTAISTKTEQK